MLYTKTTWCYALAFAFLAPFVSYAFTFGGVHIDGAEMTHDELNLSASFILSVYNKSDFTDREVGYGVRIQDETGVLIYEEISKDILHIMPGKKIEAKMSIKLPIMPAGEYDVFVTVREKSGIILSAAYTGKIRVPKSLEATTIVSDCVNLDTKALITLSCKIIGSHNGLVMYKVFSGTERRDLLTSGVEQVLKGSETEEDEYIINIDDIPTSPGRYNIMLTLIDEDGLDISNSYSAPFFVSGDWLGLDRYHMQLLGKKKAGITIYAVGNRISKQERGFKYWVLDENSEICGYGLMDLTDLSVREHYASVDIKADCAKPNLAGFVYVGYAEDGTQNITEKVGNIDFDALISGSQKNNKQYGIVVTLIALTVILGITFVFARKIGVFVLVFLLFSFVYADWPVELGNMSFNVELAKSQYFVGEPLASTTITFQDIDAGSSNFGNKPLNATVEFKNSTLGGSYTEIVGQTFTGPVSVVTLPAIASAGTYDLSFRISGLCGAFAQGLFNLGLFSQSSCEFIVPVTVVANPPSASLDVADRYVEVGGSSALQWSVRGADSCTATGAWSGAKAHSDGSHTEGTGILGSVNDYVFNLACSNPSGSDNDSRTITTFSCGDLTCTEGEQCGDSDAGTTCRTDCGTCSGTSKINTFNSNSSIVNYGDYVDISWSTSETVSCTVSGGGQVWHGAVGSVTAGPVTQETVYTIACDTGSEQISTTTKVYVNPKWREF